MDRVTFISNLAGGLSKKRGNTCEQNVNKFILLKNVVQITLIFDAFMFYFMFVVGIATKKSAKKIELFNL